MMDEELAEAILELLATAGHEGVSADAQIRVLEQIAEAMREAMT